MALTWRILVPTWPNLLPTLANLGPTLVQVRRILPPGSEKWGESEGQETACNKIASKILPRDDFGTILMDCGSHFRGFVKKICSFFKNSWHLSDHLKISPRDEFGINFDGFCKPLGRIFDQMWFQPVPSCIYLRPHGSPNIRFVKYPPNMIRSTYVLANIC